MGAITSLAVHGGSGSRCFYPLWPHISVDGSDLFKGLAMEGLEKDWTVYPVLHLDLNTGRYDSEESLYHVLDDFLSKLEAVYGAFHSEVTLELRFKA